MTVLKIDIDYKPNDVYEFSAKFADKLNFIQKFLGITVEYVEVYETEKGFHIYVYISEEIDDPKLIIILQLALGSDYKRELFNYTRANTTNWKGEWNVLFKTKKGKINERITLKAKIISRIINCRID